MSSTALARTSVFTSIDQLFQPIKPETFAELLEQYDEDRAELADLAGAILTRARLPTPGRPAAVTHFANGNGFDYGGQLAERLFSLPLAIKALDVSYWERAMALTDVYDTMPQARRTAWTDMLDKLPEVPSFDADTLAGTFAQLLADRKLFFAERVDGVFTALSPDHKTNRAGGFGTKLIIQGIASGCGVFTYACSTRTGYVHDLRRAIGTFMQRGTPCRSNTDTVINLARKHYCGEWVEVDGNSWSIRCYKNGNAHIKVHPDMAYRLNDTLAVLHPHAVAASARVKPVKRPKVVLHERPVSFDVIKQLTHDHATASKSGKWVLYQRGWDQLDKFLRADCSDVLSNLGGVIDASGWWTFDYDPKAAIEHLAVTGTVPDERAYQYYPTPLEIAERAVELAEIGPKDYTLEPSAGVGHIAKLLPAYRVTCVELSKLHCAALSAMLSDGVHHADFLTVKPDQIGTFERVVMNPPFRRQWRAHLEHAATFVDPGGRLVAILPTSAVGNVELDGFAVRWADQYDNAFAGCSASVTILVADRAVSC